MKFGLCHLDRVLLSGVFRDGLYHFAFGFLHETQPRSNLAELLLWGKTRDFNMIPSIL